MEIKKIEEKLDYRFRDPDLLETALTHSSYKREHPGVKEDNERLEFLGDGVLDAVIGLRLYQKLNNKPEGVLTKVRSLVVCERSLAALGKELGLNNHIRFGTGEKNSGGANKDSIIADAVEAVIGAVLVDGGYDSCEKVILHILDDTLEQALTGSLYTDFKSEFQEKIQKKGHITEINYVVDGSEGPDHDKVFKVHVEVDGVNMGCGSGKSKKEAGQNAAREAIKKINEVN